MCPAARSAPAMAIATSPSSNASRLPSSGRVRFSRERQRARGRHRGHRRRSVPQASSSRTMAYQLQFLLLSCPQSKQRRRWRHSLCSSRISLPESLVSIAEDQQHRRRLILMTQVDVANFLKGEVLERARRLVESFNLDTHAARVVAHICSSKNDSNRD